MSDENEEQEEAWIADEHSKVVLYLKKSGIDHLGVGEWPAFHLHPHLAIWAVESKKSPGAIGWWAISGDAPTDYMSGAGVGIREMPWHISASSGLKSRSTCPLAWHILIRKLAFEKIGLRSPHS